MTDSFIQQLDSKLKTRLRTRAKKHGRTIEQEAKSILAEVLAVDPAPSQPLLDQIRARVIPLGGIELPAVPRPPIRVPVLGEQ